MNKNIVVNFPQDLLFSLKMNNNEFQHEIKILAIIKLYELSKISAGNAAKILDISKIEFLESLSKYNVSIFNEQLITDLESDLKNA